MSTNPSAGKRLLRCSVCGRTEDVSSAELLQFMKAGWPKCCDEVMTYYVQGDRSGPDDTSEEVPALP